MDDKKMDALEQLGAKLSKMDADFGRAAPIKWTRVEKKMIDMRHKHELAKAKMYGERRAIVKDIDHFWPAVVHHQVTCNIGSLKPAWDSRNTTRRRLLN
jgi:hypothetical protein